jgi:F0F1-type ATP synthase assembly protein I
VSERPSSPVPRDDSQDTSVLGHMSQDVGPAHSVLSYLLAGPLAFGLIGWGLDTWWGTAFLGVVGLLFGMGLAFYVIWLRYGRA